MTKLIKNLRITRKGQEDVVLAKGMEVSSSVVGKKKVLAYVEDGFIKQVVVAEVKTPAIALTVLTKLEPKFKKLAKALMGGAPFNTTKVNILSNNTGVTRGIVSGRFFNVEVSEMEPVPPSGKITKEAMKLFTTVLKSDPKVVVKGKKLIKNKYQGDSVSFGLVISGIDIELGIYNTAKNDKLRRRGRPVLTDWTIEFKVWERPAKEEEEEQDEPDTVEMPLRKIKRLTPNLKALTKALGFKVKGSPSIKVDKQHPNNPYATLSYGKAKSDLVSLTKLGSMSKKSFKDLEKVLKAKTKLKSADHAIESGGRSSQMAFKFIIEEEEVFLTIRRSTGRTNGNRPDKAEPVWLVIFTISPPKGWVHPKL